MSAEIIVIYCIIHKLFVRACFGYEYLVSLPSLSGTPILSPCQTGPADAMQGQLRLLD